MSIQEKLTTIAENEQKVYDKGKADGKSAEWNALWDAFQQLGERNNYINAFSSRDGRARTAWTKETFKPKYDINATKSAEALFDRSTNLDIDLVEWLENLGITLNTKGATSMYFAFYGTVFTRLPVIDLSSANNTAYCFNYNVKCTKIDKIICSANTAWHSSTFDFANLEECIFEGVIGSNNFNLSKCTKLNRESLLTAINCFDDYSGTTTKRTATFGTTNLDKLTDSEKAIATQKGWTLA